MHTTIYTNIMKFIYNSVESIIKGLAILIIILLSITLESCSKPTQEPIVVTDVFTYEEIHIDGSSIIYTLDLSKNDTLVVFNDCIMDTKNNTILCDVNKIKHLISY